MTERKPFVVQFTADDEAEWRRYWVGREDNFGPCAAAISSAVPLVIYLRANTERHEWCEGTGWTSHGRCTDCGGSGVILKGAAAR